MVGTSNLGSWNGHWLKLLKQLNLQYWQMVSKRPSIHWWIWRKWDAKEGQAQGVHSWKEIMLVSHAGSLNRTPFKKSKIWNHTSIHSNGGKTTQNWTRAKKPEGPLKSGGKHFGFLQVLTQLKPIPWSPPCNALNLACRPKAWIRAVPQSTGGMATGEDHPTQKLLG